MQNYSLREEFDKILQEYGHWVILQRTSRKIRCRCWNERSQEADSKCPLCLGSGWVSRAERHLVRQENASQVVSRPAVRTQTEPGIIWTPANQFFFRHDAHPQVGDMIYEVGWKGNRPVNLIAAHVIQHAEPVRGERGRIEYWNVFTRTVTVDKAFREQMIRTRFGAVPNYRLPGGDSA